MKKLLCTFFLTTVFTLHCSQPKVMTSSDCLAPRPRLKGDPYAHERGTQPGVHSSCGDHCKCSPTPFYGLLGNSYESWLKEEQRKARSYLIVSRSKKL